MNLLRKIFHWKCRGENVLKLYFPDKMVISIICFECMHMYVYSVPDKDIRQIG
jgi:hypothetical protein